MPDHFAVMGEVDKEYVWSSVANAKEQKHFHAKAMTDDGLEVRRKQ